MNRKHILISLASLTFFGCAPQMLWVKPNANQNEFAQVRYECLQNSQQNRSVAQYNNVGGYVSGASNSQGYAVSGVVTNEQLFAACMNSKGWYLEAQRSDPTSSIRFNLPSSPPKITSYTNDSDKNISLRDKVVADKVAEGYTAKTSVDGRVFLSKNVAIYGWVLESGQLVLTNKK